MLLLSSTESFAQQANEVDMVNQLIDDHAYQKAVNQIDSLLSTGQLKTNAIAGNQLIRLKADCYYYLNDLESSFEYHVLAGKNEESGIKPDKAFISEAFGNAASTLTDLGLYEKSISYSKLSYTYAQQIQDSTGMATAIANLGVAYKHLGNYKLAFKHFEEAYAMNKDINDSIGLADDLNNLAYLSKEWKKYDQALAYFEESMAIVKKAGLKKEIATRFNNVAQVYLAMGNIPEADRNISKAMAIDEEIKDSLNLSKHINFLGEIFEFKGAFQKAINCHLKALEMQQGFKTQSLIAISCRMLSQSYFGLNQPEQAITWLDQGIEIATVNRFFSELMTQYDLKAKHLYAIGNNEEAQYYEKSYKVMKDSIFSIENGNSLKIMKLVNELDKKEAEIESQKLLVKDSMNNLEAYNKRFIIGLIVVFVILAILMIYLFRLRQEEKSKVYQLEIDDLKGKLQALVQNNPESFSIKIKDINCRINHSLTEKEFEVVKFIFTKKSNLEIGTELSLSVNTVKFHFKNIYKKFGVSNRKEALQFLLTPA